MQDLERKIRSDALAARKARDSVRANLTGTLIGEIEKRAKAPGRSGGLDDAGVLAIVGKFRKDAGETIAALPEGDARLEQARAEAAILDGYRPAQMDDEAIRAFVLARKSEGMSGTGPLMGALKAAHGGAYDGRAAAAIVKSLA